MTRCYYRRWKFCAAAAALWSYLWVTDGRADVYLGKDGGLEGIATVDDSTTFSTGQSNKWTKDNATITISQETVNIRSGANALRVLNASTTGRRIRSPFNSFGSKTTGITIQYYRMITNVSNSASNQEGVVRSSTESLQGTYDRPASANSWDKQTYSPASATFTSIVGVILSRGPTASGGNIYIDDMCIYDGSVDTTAPNAPGSVVVENATTTSLDIRWGAASGGVDSGGYLVVRYTASPAASDDPNANGIYASNNTFTVTLTGTVRYQGTGTNFTDTGLASSQAYYYKVYTYDKAYNYSSESSGNGTTLSSCTPVGAVTFVQQTNYYTKYSSGGDIFNVDAARMGMWANSGSEQAVAWRAFRTDGSGGGELRELQPGDRFRVTINGPNPSGLVGVSINDGAATGSWDNRTNNTRGFIQVQGGGANDYFVTHGGGTPAWSGVRPNSTDQTLVFDILSSAEFTANIEGQTAKYDLSMLNGPGDGDRVDGFSLFLNNDAGDIHWKQTTMVTNLGYVELGADNGTRSIAGKITDSTDPACTNTAAPNLLRKTGTGTVTLQNTANTYTMGTRVEAGTLAVFNDGSLGAAPGGAVATNLNIWSSGTLRATNSFTISANRGIALGDVSGPGIEVDSGKTLTYAGALGGNAEWNKKGTGTLALTGTSSTNNGKVVIQGGTLQLAGDGSLGAVPGAASEKINIWSTGTLEANATFTLNANRRIELGAVAGPKISVAGGYTLTYGGQISGSANWSKESAGTLALTGAVGSASGTLVLNAGTVAFDGTNTSQAVGVTASGFLYGNGSIGALTITGQVSAGGASNTVGNLRTTSLNLQDNGRLQVNFSAMTGTAGTDWDVITVGGGSGTYTVNAADGSDFVLALKGNPTFNNALGYTNIIADAGTASGFVSNKFTVSTDEFTPGLGGGAFVVDAAGGDLRLIFIPSVVAEPDMGVLGTNGAAISNGDVAPSAADGTDFGQVYVLGARAVTNVFAITNAGTANLTLSSVSTSSAMGAAADFAVLSWPSTISPGAKSNLVIAFDPSDVGVRTALVSIANNDTNNNPYTFVLAGEGTGAYSAITLQGFEGSAADTWTYTRAAGAGDIYVDGDTNAGGAYALTFRGSASSNSDPYLEFDTIDLSGYGSVTLRVAFAVAGADNGDDLELDLSYDGGTTWNGPGSTTLVYGASNTNLGFTGTGASTVPANPWTVALPSTAQQVRVRIRFDESANDNTFDRFFVDDIELSGMGAAPTVALGDVLYSTSETDATVTVPVSISASFSATVQVALAGTATGGGTDYSANTTNVIFSAGGATTSNLVFTLNNDGAAEGPEEIGVTLVAARGARVGGPAAATVVIQDDDAITIMSANLTSGTNLVDGTYWYTETSQRIFKRLRPDVVAIQEWKFTNAGARAFVDAVFGTNYYYYIEPESDPNPIPNGVISRWPITASNEWTDTYVGARDHAQVTIDIPGNRDLHVVSTHFKAGPGDAATRESQARELTNYIAGAAFPTNDYVVVAGDLNLTNRTETTFVVVTSVVTDAHQPADRDGDLNTNLGRSAPYDFVLPNHVLDADHLAVAVAGVSFANGVVFDSRQYKDHLTPILVEDSYEANRTHMAVVKVFTISTSAAPPTVTTTIASATNQTTATAGGNVTDDGGASVTNRGVVWALDPATPTVPGAQTTNGTGTGSYSSTLTNLTPGATYNYRAFAQNSAGTGYGATNSLTTPCFSGIVTGLVASATNETDFTAAWSNFAGATGYSLDVSTNATFGGAGSPDLFFSEYVEGSSNNKFLEIYNGTGASVDLSNYKVLHFNNGASTPTYSLTLSGTLSAGAVYVIENSSESLGVTADLSTSSSVMNFNGDDAIALTNTLAGGYADVIGQIGTDPGTEWGTGSASTADNTIRRMSSVTGGDTNGANSFDPATEWDGYATDTVSGLGSHTGGASPSYVPGYSNRTVSVSGASVTGLTGGATYYFRVRATNDYCATDNSATQSVTTISYVPDVAALGTNLAAIVISNTAPAIANGTDFGSIGVNLSNRMHTFTITNSGTAALGVGTVTTTGTHAADFIVVSQPAASIAAGGSSTFQVQFDPGAAGQRDATLTFTNTVSGKTPYPFAARGTGVLAGIGYGPAATSVTVMVGTTPSAAAFGVTNVGRGRLDYATSTNAAWLSVSPVSANLNEGGAQAHTISFNVTGLSAGTSNATVTITDAGASNSPQTVAVTLILTNIPNPTAVSAWAHGRELIRLGWTRPTGLDVMIVYRETNAPSVPAQGQGYSIGDTYGGDGSRVIYKGSAAQLEHVVLPGRTNHYALHAINNDHYSPGVATNIATTAYPASEIVEPFAYTNTGTLATGGHGGGGNGWTNSWQYDTGNFNISSGNFANISVYPTNAANRVRINSADIDGTSKAARRHFAAYTTGKVYAAYMLNYAYNGANKFAGLSFMDGTNEMMYYGEDYNSDQKLAVGSSSTATNIYAGVGNDYLIVGLYDFTADTGYGLVYKIGTDSVPASEPSVWHGSHSNNAIARIDGIRIAAGAGGGSGTPGDTYFDEIRVATSWELLLANYAQPEIAALGTNLAVLTTANTPDYANGSDFGATAVTGGQVDRTLFITNSDAGALNVSGLSTSGAQAADFIVVSWPAKVSPGAVSNLVLRFDPFASGVRTGAITIASDDADEGSYVFHVRGTGQVPPTVATTIASATNQTSATAGGNVTDDGYAPVTNRGVVWSASAGPTVPGAQTTNGTGTGSYSSTLTNLTPGAPYYYRAFAQNSAGTGYGTEYTLTTLCFSGLVTGHYVSATNDVNFTVVWSNFADASGYALDVSSNAGFAVNSGGSVYTNTWEGASKGAYASGTVVIAGITWWMDDALIGTSASDRKNGSNAARVQNSGVIGMQTSTNMGLSSITLLHGVYGSDGNSDGRVEYSTDGWATWSTAGTFTATSTSLTAFEATNLNVSGSVAVRIVKTSGGGDRYNLDDILLHPYSQAPSFVPGYSNRAVSGTSASVTGLVSGATYYYRIRATNAYCATENSTTGSVTTVVLAASIDILGNGALIVDGDATPSPTDHTDFGGVGLVNSNLVRTFTITNAGPGALSVYGVSTSGAAAADFIVIAPPGTPVSADATTTFQVRFNPTALGTRTATLAVSNNVTGKTLYDFVVQGTGVAASLVVAPSSLSVTSVLGSAPAGLGFGVTNSGRGDLVYGVATNVNWLSVSPNAATNAETEGRQHTLTFTAPGLHAGVSNATITVTDTNAVGSPQVVAVEWTLTAIPPVLSAGVTNDGNELVRIGWTKDSGYDVMIVHNRTNPPSAPANGTSYSVGGAVGSDGSRVIYSGGGAELQHVVAPGSDNYYAFYSVNNNHYSTPLSTNTTTGAYAAGEIVEPFAYTSGVTMISRQGGNGWGANFWTGDTNAFSVSNLSFAAQTNYPTPRANKLAVTPQDGGSNTIRRQFTNTYASGRLYVGYIVNFQYSGADKYAGLSLMSNTTERLFVGEVSTADLRLGLDGSSSNRVLNNGAGNDYIVVMRYDWSSGLAAASAYKVGTDAVPDSEPTAWDMMLSKASNAVGRINGLRLVAGTTGSGTPGTTYFDEIRVATNWSELIQMLPSRVIYDGFASSSGALSGGGGGTGWSDTWAIGGDPFADYTATSFGIEKSSYYQPTGNKIVLYGDVNGRWITASRTFLEPFTNGAVYFSWMMNYEFNGTDKYAGLKLLDGGSEKAFVGKVSGADKALGIDSSSSNQTSTNDIENASGNDYVVVAKYDFATRVLSATTYRTITNAVAEEPNGYWLVTTTQGVGHITSLTGVRLSIGAGASVQVGDVYYDEVRVGTNWFEVTRKDGEAQAPAMANGPTPRLLYVGTNYNPALNPQGILNDITVTDADLINTADPLDIAILWSNSYGVFMTNASPAIKNISSRLGRVTPNYDPVVLTGSQFQSTGADASFTNFAGNNGSTVVTTYQHRAFNITNSTYDDAYYITVSAENNNLGGGTFAAPNAGDAIPYWRALTVNTALQFYVQDDDISYPELLEFTIDGVGGSGVSNLSAGGIAVIGVNGTATGDLERFSFVVLAPFPAGTVIEFTDCGWDPTDLSGTGDWHRVTEFHTNKWVATGNIDVGRVIELTLNDINNGGDQVTIFQYYGATTASNDSENVNFVYAVNLGPRWYDPPGDPIPDDNQSSALYRGLTNGTTAVSVPLDYGVANARYIGPMTGTASYLLLQISDSNNWESLATGYHDITNYSFEVTGAGAFDWNTPELSDAQVLAGGFMVTNILRDLDSGVLASNTSFGHAPYFMLFNTNDQVVVSNLFVVSFTNGTRTVITNANNTFSGQYDRITIGMGEALVAWSDADGDRSLDTLMTTSRVPVLIFDDDPDEPVAGAMTLLNGSNTVTEQAGPVQLLAAWNFNASNTTATSGSGTWSDNLLTAPTYGNAGTTINAVSGDTAGADITITAGSGLQNNGRYIQFLLNMSGSEGLVMTYSARRSGTGFTTNLVAYSTDGVSFTPFATNTPTQDSHALRSNDFGAVTALDDQGAVYIRITLDGATATAGNNRFDNFQFNALRRVFTLTDGALALVASTNPLSFSFSVYDETSGVARGTSSDGTNMNVSIPGMATNNTTNYAASASSAGTLAPSSTSLWQFTSFTYAQIGDLYGGGTNLIPVTANISDLDNDRLDDRLQLTNRSYGTFFVTDDDTNTPVVANVNLSGASAAPFVVATNGVAPTNLIRNFIARRTGSGTDTLTTVTDQELADATNIQFQFVFGVRDAHSGVSRGVSGTTNEVMSFSLGTNITGNFTDYSAALSTPQATTNLLLTNYWTFGNFDSAAINALMASTGNPVHITMPDLDDDRPSDRATDYSRLVGYVRVVDDDIRGPIINSADIAGAYGTNVTMYSSFETNQNWPASSLGSGTPWTNDATTGRWIADGATFGALDPKISGTRRIGLLTNSLAEPRWIQLPPIADPGTLVLFAGRFSGNDVTLRVERADGASWISVGSRVVTNLNPEFELFSWDINVTGVTTLRVVHAGTGPQVYMDDISVYPQAIWISTNSLTMSWEEALDDFSTVAEYRVVAPAQSAAQPATTNDGTGLSASVRTNSFNITGQQGVLTGYLFAVDNDADRGHDQAIGNLQKLVVRVDTNPPPVPTALRATDAAAGYLFGSIDESSEILVQWTPPGTNASQSAGWRQSDSEALSPWETYIITYYEVVDTNGTPAANAVTQVLTRATAGWSNALSSYAFTNLLLSNLTFDSYYKITVQGRDEAGNIGLSTSVVGNTDRFVVTQGLARANMGLSVRWTGPTNETTYRDYDVIFVDSSVGFHASLTNSWDWLTYTNRPRLEDYGGTNRVAPGWLTGTTYRMYRVAREDRWRTNQSPRLASVEIYAAKALRLHPGENWYSLFSWPDPATTNEQESTVAYVFGTNTLHASNTYAQSTRISWFGATTGATNIGTVATSIVWLSSSAGWQYALGGSGAANEKRVPLGQGFMIEVPTNAAATNLVLIGRLPTQSLSRVISAPVSTNIPEFHVLSHQMPERITVSNFVSQFSGFGAGPFANYADEIRILDNSQTNGVAMGSLRSPRMRIWYSSIAAHSNAPWRRATTGSPANNPSAMGEIIEPDDAIIIVRRKSGTVTFVNTPTYPPPTRNITP